MYRPSHLKKSSSILATNNIVRAVQNWTIEQLASQRGTLVFTVATHFTVRYSAYATSGLFHTHPYYYDVAKSNNVIYISF